MEGFNISSCDELFLKYLMKYWRAAAGAASRCMSNHPRWWCWRETDDSSISQRRNPGYPGSGDWCLQLNRLWMNHAAKCCWTCSLWIWYRHLWAIRSHNGRRTRSDFLQDATKIYVRSKSEIENGVFPAYAHMKQKSSLKMKLWLRQHCHTMVRETPVRGQESIYNWKLEAPW